LELFQVPGHVRRRSHHSREFQCCKNGRDLILVSCNVVITAAVVHDSRDTLRQLNSTLLFLDTSTDACRMLSVCCSPDQSFLRRLLFPEPAVAGSDVTPIPPVNRSHQQTALSCSSRVSVIRF